MLLVANPIADAVAKMRLFYIRRQDSWYVRIPYNKGLVPFYGPFTKAQAIARRTAWAKRLAQRIPIDS